MADPKTLNSDPVADFVAPRPRKSSFSEVGQYPALVDAQELPGTGYEFDPVKRFTEGIASGAHTMAANANYAEAMWHSIKGDERKRDEAIYSAGLSQIQGAGSQTIGSAELFHRFLDAPTFGGFIESSMGFMGEMGPSAAATITTALTGSAIGALVTTAAGGTALAGVAGASAVGTGGKVAAGLAMKGYTRNQIKDSIKKALKREQLNKDQIKLMEDVYSHYRNTVLKRNTIAGGLTGAAAQEYPQGAGTFFGNFAEEGMTDPMAAWMSAGLGVPFTAIGLGSEAVVFKTVTNLMKKKGVQQSLLNPNRPNTSIMGQIAKGTGISTLSESLAELGQQELEIQQKYIIDEEYTQEQAKLDRITSAFAGAAGGFGIGGSLSSVSSVVGKANELMHENQVKKAINDMFVLKADSDKSGLVMREPAKWIKGQFKAMLDPDTKKDAVWVDSNSLDELEKVEGELAEEYGTDSVYRIVLPSSVGGVLFTTNPEKLESFNAQMALRTPSQALLEDALAAVLDYPRSRRQGDEWVVEVRDKEGVPVHYHQTSNPKNEGEGHLEDAKAYFNYNPNYTYQLVEGEEHITERAGLISPFDYTTNSAPQEEAMDLEIEETIEKADPELLARYKSLIQKAVKAGGIDKLNAQDQQNLQLDYQAVLSVLETNKGEITDTENQTPPQNTDADANQEESDADMGDNFGDGVLPNMQEVNLYNTQGIEPIRTGELGSDTNPFLGKKSKPWAVPSGKYQNEFPTEEDVEDVLDLYPLGHPFRSEFLELLAQKQLSKSVVTALIEKSGQEVSNENESLRIEKADIKGGRTNTAYQIVKYRVPIDSPMDLSYNSEIGRMLRRSKKRRAATGFDPDAEFNDSGTSGRKMKTGSRWSVQTKNAKSNPQQVDMPFLVNQMKKYLDRTGFGNNAAFGSQLQNSFVSLYEMLSQENSEFELLYDFKPVTEEALQEGIIYTRENGKKKYTFSDLIQFDENTSTVLRGSDKKQALSSVQDLEIELELVNDRIETIQNEMKDLQGPDGVTNWEVFTPLVEELYGPKVGDPATAKRNDPEKNMFMRRGRIEAEIETIKGTLDQSDFLMANDPSADIQSEESTGEMSTDERWEGEYDSWKKQPLSKNQNVKNYSAGRAAKDENIVYPSINGKKINKDTKVELSENVDEHFGEESGFIKLVIDTANNTLGIKKPMLVFSTQELIDLGNEGMNQRIKDVQTEVQEKPGRKAKNIPFRDYDIIILDTRQNMPTDLQGLFLKTIGHEIGHSFLRQQLQSSLKNPKLRKQLQKMYEEDVKENPNVTAWQGEKGMDEWYSDKTAGVLFDLDKGIIYKATTLAESFIKKVADKIQSFYTSLTNRISKQADPAQSKQAETIIQRFAYNEQFAEYINGVNNVQTESTREQNVEQPGYQELAHIEDMLDEVFGKDTAGHKTMRRLDGLVNKMLTTGKLPKGFRKLFETAHKHMERLGADKGTGLKIANFFHKLSGAKGVPGMINEANRLANELGNEMLVLLGEQEYTPTVVEALNEAANEDVNTEDLSEKGQIVRKFVDSLHKRFDLESLGIKKRKNFFPRILAINAIAHDTTKKQALIDLLVKNNQGKTFVRTIFDKKTGKPLGKQQFIVDEKEATEAVEHLIRKNQNNLEDTKKEEKEYDVAVAKNRVAMFEALKTPELIKLELYESADIAFFEYIRKTTRRVEFEKRGGSAKLEELVNELPESEQEIAREIIDALLGRISPIKNDIWKHVTSYGLFMNVVTLLSMAVFASLPDAAGPVLRSREINMKSIFKNLAAGLKGNQGAELAKSFGANAVESIATMSLNSGEVDTMLPDAKKWTDNWFRWTQLERWTRFTRSFAAGMGRDFLLKHAKNIKEGVPNSESVLTSIRYLEELDLTGPEIDAWNGQPLTAHPKIKTALGRFVDEAIVRPNAAERPVWASDPHYALVWQLKSFYYAYGKNIIGGLFREGKTLYGANGNIPASLTPLFMGAATLLPLTMLGWDLRERFKMGLAMLLPGISPNDPGVNYRQSQSMSSGEYWFDVLDRSGSLGPYALAIPLFMEDKRYGNPWFIPILGPTAEKSWELATGDFDPLDYAPVYSQLNTTALSFKQ